MMVERAVSSPERVGTWARVVDWSAAIGFICFVGLAVVVADNPRLGIDVEVTRWIGDRQQQWLIDVLNVVRLMVGQLPLMVTPFIVLGLWRLRRYGQVAALMLFVAVLMAFVMSVAVKTLIDRPRPDQALLDIAGTESTGSFPSSSVTIAVVFMAAMILLAVDARRATGWARFGSFVAAAAIVLIGPARIYAGEHWLTDVIGGYFLALFIVATTLRVGAIGSRTESGKLGGTCPST